MRYRLLASLLGLSITSVNAASAVILEQANGTPSGWSIHHKASASDKITLFVALKEPGIEELKAKLNQRHTSSGQHMSRDEVHNYRQPAQTTTNAVSEWLKSRGVREFDNRGSIISFEASAQTVKSLFQADLAYYAYNGSDAAPVLRALSYTVPTWLRDHIDFVHPISNFMPPRAPRGHRHHPKPKPKPKPKPHPKPTKSTSKPATSTSTPIGIPTIPPDDTQQPNLPCLAATVPDCIKDLYNITYTASSPSPVRFGVAGFLEQWILESDVSIFLDILAPHIPAPDTNFTIELLNNGTNPQTSPFHAGIEASLDIQYALSLSHPAQVTYYSTGGRGTKLDPATGATINNSSRSNDNEPFLEFLTALLAKPSSELPHVLSISYADDEPSVPRPYALRVCDMFAALTARGVSELVASGDGGAAGTGQTACTDEKGRKRFVPTFPGSCPYVTAVGATDTVGPPVAGADFSGGGFSEYFGRPKWQDGVVGGMWRGWFERLMGEWGCLRKGGGRCRILVPLGPGFRLSWQGI
jgi:tripeptidyl-peptidase-1